MKSRCFVVVFDKKYYKYAAVLLQSLAENYRKRLDVICIVPDDLIANDYLESLKLKLIDASHLNIQFRTSGGHHLAKSKPWDDIAVYQGSQSVERVLLSSICHEYDEAIYMDTDCIFVNDATKLIEHPIPGASKIVALPEYSIIAERDLKAPEKAYFNNGVFITDLNFWRENNIENLIVDWMINNDTGNCIEQTGMNAILYDYWFPLSGNFNYWDNFSVETPLLRICYPNPVVIHFVGPLKPWNNFQDDTIMKRGPYDKVWKYIYNQLWGADTLYEINA
jgi:lipopolysaccharide biosynthesis glycosyltransferase